MFQRVLLLFFFNFTLYFMVQGQLLCSVRMLNILEVKDLFEYLKNYFLVPHKKRTEYTCILIFYCFIYFWKVINGTEFRTLLVLAYDSVTFLSFIISLSQITKIITNYSYANFQISYICFMLVFFTLQNGPKASLLYRICTKIAFSQGFLALAILFI